MKKIYRVKKSTEIENIIKNKKSSGNKYFNVYKKESFETQNFRYAISVGKKIGNAVHRVWVKRRIRQSLLELKPQIKPDVDFIVIARPSADQITMDEAKKHLTHVLKLAQLIDDEAED